MPRANQLNGKDWLQRSFSIWRNIGKDKDARDHPAAFPVALASRLIECYAADETGIVFDPFAGSGSTLLAALNAGMEAIGSDINPHYREIFKRRLPSDIMKSNRWSYEIQDSRVMNGMIKPESIEICITSPPYWDILNRRRSADKKKTISYSNSEDDLGNITDYDDFLKSLGLVAGCVEKSLRGGGYFILNVMDIRKGSRFYPLHQDAALVLQDTGNFVLNDIIIWDRQPDYNNMKTLGYPHKFIINKVHEYLLVFRKEKENG